MKTIKITDYLKNFIELGEGYEVIEIERDGHPFGLYFPQGIRTGNCTMDISKGVKPEYREEVKKATSGDKCEKCRKNDIYGTYVENDWESGTEMEHRLCAKCSIGFQKKK